MTPVQCYLDVEGILALAKCALSLCILLIQTEHDTLERPVLFFQPAA